MNLFDCRERWRFNGQYDCWCLEDVIYSDAATNPEAQSLSIFVPRPYLFAPGEVDPSGAMGNYTAKTAPVVFENNASGYREMSWSRLGDFRDESAKYLARGMVYVTCGCRGWNSADAEGRRSGKAPNTLVDFKTAIRFLRHNARALPGDFSKMISVGWSAGGAMSALLAMTADDPAYEAYLEENGAYMDESDAVLAAQIYCPITDLEHADAAYEWQFSADEENEATPFNPPGRMTAFQKALSQKLSERYVSYFNGLSLREPETGEILTLGPDGRSGSAYEYLMHKLEDAATVYLNRLSAGELEDAFDVGTYLDGNYARPTHRVTRTAEGFHHETVDVPGRDKHAWLRWDGERAHISSLDDYVLQHRRRMKPCTAFDDLDRGTPENRLFGAADKDAVHFSEEIPEALEQLQEQFPLQTEQLLAAYVRSRGEEALREQLSLINPMNFVGHGAEHYRIRVGACDADTAFSVSMVLALTLANAGKDVDYALVWDRPHCEADYPGEVCDWSESLCE